MGIEPTLSAETRRPPLPKGLYKVINPLLIWLLGSPLGARLAGDLMVIRFTGRKSGKTFTTPVGYLRQGQAVLMFTRSPWWRNFTSDAAVQMLIQRQWLPGIAHLITDPDEYKASLQALMAHHPEPRARQMGLWVDGIAAMTPEQAAAAAGEVKLVRVDLDEA